MIDTHLHLWRLGAGWYGWNTPDLGAVHADSEIGQIRHAMAQVGVSAAVVVQAADRLEETSWLLDLAADEPLLSGVVGYLPLDHPAELEEMLANHAGSGLVGVRQLWHDHDDPDDLAAVATVRCLRLLGESGLPVDVPNAFPGLWTALTAAAAAAPTTTFVLDHCGKPPFGDTRAWPRWEQAFRELASRTNVVVKLSGLFDGGPTRATDDELVRVVELTREVAGADRTMVGSDWPMPRGLMDYPQTLRRVDALLATWSAAERAQAQTGTALVTYGDIR